MTQLGPPTFASQSSCLHLLGRTRPDPQCSSGNLPCLSGEIATSPDTSGLVLQTQAPQSYVGSLFALLNDVLRNMSACHTEMSPSKSTESVGRSCYISEYPGLVLQTQLPSAKLCGVLAALLNDAFRNTSLYHNEMSPVRSPHFTRGGNSLNAEYLWMRATICVGARMKTLLFGRNFRSRCHDGCEE
ncbi:hypothetical protein B0H34DRAFT_432923 [Crassisporium funariophilum]|nr:hypothetical protein B0H34DRAFT_432923 [Crassisporium funariophilum]